MKWHPDKHANKAEAEAKFVEITEAYEFILADTARQAKAGSKPSPSKDDGAEKEPTEAPAENTTEEQEGRSDEDETPDENPDARSSSAHDDRRDEYDAHVWRDP